MASTTTTDASAPAPSAHAVPAPTLLKTDVLGRVRSTAERRAAILAEFARSGLSAAQFAKLAGLNSALPIISVKVPQILASASSASERGKGRVNLKRVDESPALFSAPHYVKLVVRSRANLKDHMR